MIPTALACLQIVGAAAGVGERLQQRFPRIHLTVVAAPSCPHHLWRENVDTTAEKEKKKA
jgi:hypothetical protein